MHRIRIAITGSLLALAVPAGADTLHVLAAGRLAAGRLTDAVSDLLRRFPAGTDAIAPAEFGPSGLLRAAIEAGRAADMDQPRRRAGGHPERTVMLFTRNRLCALARPALGLTPANMLDKLLDPAKSDAAVRLVDRVTGADGDTASVALAELAPQFAGHPIQLALAMNGTPLRDQSVRLIVPGDRRGGRSVREVVRIALE